MEITLHPGQDAPWHELAGFGSVRPAASGANGAIRVAGVRGEARFQVVRSGFFRLEATLRDGSGAEVATFRSGGLVAIGGPLWFGGAPYRLVGAGFLGRWFALRAPDGTELARVKAVRWGRRGTPVRVTAADVDPAVLLFTVWVAKTRASDTATAARSASGAGAAAGAG